jgi:hypothetical protein
MLEVACSGMGKIVRGPLMGVVAAGYPISHKLGRIIKQNVFHKLMLFQIQ